MTPEEVAALVSLGQTLSVSGFLFYAWFNERKERIERTDTLIKWKDEERVQVLKEEKKEVGTPTK